jgi:hypothetical protein
MFSESSLHGICHNCHKVTSTIIDIVIEIIKIVTTVTIDVFNRKITIVSDDMNVTTVTKSQLVQLNICRNYKSCHNCHNWRHIMGTNLTSPTLANLLANLPKQKTGRYFLLVHHTI